MLLVDCVELSPGSDVLLTPRLPRSGRMHASSRPRIADGSLLVEEQTRWSGQCKGALRLYSLLKGQGLRRVCPVGGGEHTGLWVHLSKTLGTLGHVLAADRANHDPGSPHQVRHTILTASYHSYYR